MPQDAGVLAKRAIDKNRQPFLYGLFETTLLSLP